MCSTWITTEFHMIPRSMSPMSTVIPIRMNRFRYERRTACESVSLPIFSCFLTPCVPQTHLVWRVVTASAPSAICQPTPSHVYALLLSVSHDNLHLDPCDLTSVCLHPNYLDKLRAGPQDRPEPRALILSADLLTWPGAERHRRSSPAGVVKT